jgi:hypothetical protein
MAASYHDQAWERIRKAIPILLVAMLLLFPVVFRVYSKHAMDASNSILVKRLSLRDLVSILQFDEGIKLAFAETPYSYSDKITNREQLNRLHAIPLEERTQKEKDWIRAWEGLFKQHPEFNIDVDFAKQERFTLVIPKGVSTVEDVTNLLKTIAALDKRYVLSSFHTIYILSDKDSIVHTDRISLKLSHAPAEMAIIQLNDAVSDKGIDVGWSPSSDSEFKNVKITLNLYNVTLAEAFSRFAEALGSTVSWQLLESRNQKYLYFNKIRLFPDRWNNILVQ